MQLTGWPFQQRAVVAAGVAVLLVELPGLLPAR